MMHWVLPRIKKIQADIDALVSDLKEQEKKIKMMREEAIRKSHAKSDEE